MLYLQYTVDPAFYGYSNIAYDAQIKHFGPLEQGYGFISIWEFIYFSSYGRILQNKNTNQNKNRTKLRIKGNIQQTHSQQ